MSTYLAEAEVRGILPPTARTLAKYGITPEFWCQLLASQDWKCAVCRRSNRRWNTDHEHTPGWARKSPAERAIYVRGILCWHCNKHVVQSNLTASEARRITAYLENYEERRRNSLEAWRDK